MAKAKNQQQRPPSTGPVGPRPSAEEQTQIALNKFVEMVVGTQPGNSGELVALMNDARDLTDPVRVRAFLTRELLRAACFAIDHEVYGPLVRKVLEAGLAACSRPGDDATAMGKERWSEVRSALAEHLGSGPDTPQQRNADRCAVVAAALAAALADPRPRFPVSWFNAGIGVLWVLADDASAPGQADDLGRLHEALRKDIAKLSELAPPVGSLPAREDGPLGPLWPDGAPYWYRPVTLPAIPEQLTPDEERRTLGGMAGKQTASAKTKEAVADPLAAAVDAFAEVKPPALTVASLGKVSPENAAEVLEALTRYMDEAGDAVVGVLRVLLRGLHGKSFKDLETTKAFAARVQSLLDRSEHAVECARCGEPGRYEGAPHHSVPSGSLRVRHPSNTTHGGSTSVSDMKLKKRR